MVQPMPFISTLPAIWFHVWNIKRSLKRDPLAAGSPRTPDLAVLCALLCDLGSWAPVPRLSDPPLGPRQGRCHPYGLMVEIQAIKMVDPIGDGGSYCLTIEQFSPEPNCCEMVGSVLVVMPVLPGTALLLCREELRPGTGGAGVGVKFRITY